MKIKCSECDVWFEINDIGYSTNFYTKCPTCKCYLDIEITINVSKKDIVE